MRFRTLWPTDPKEVKQEIEWGLSDGRLINYTEFLLKQIDNFSESKGDGKLPDEVYEHELKVFAEAKTIYDEELKKRDIAYQKMTPQGGRPYYLFTKGKDYIFLCEICRFELANRSGFCPKCEGELQELTNAWNSASDKVKDYFRERIEEEYEDD